MLALGRADRDPGSLAVNKHKVCRRNWLTCNFSRKRTNVPARTNSPDAACTSHIRDEKIAVRQEGNAIGSEALRD